jgi:putative ABC transport system ATP-binding protein
VGPGALVDVEGLVHIYRTDELEVVALQGLDLQVGEREMIAIVGRSGSGKTTLMNVLAGVEAPSAGRAHVAGHDLARMTGAERESYRRDVVGYVWQRSQVNLWPELDARENVQVPMLADRRSAAKREARAADLLEALGLERRRNRRPGQLTGAEQQRLALAVALANGPRVLLADEPTAELDGPAAQSLLVDLAAVVRHAGAAVVMVTHDHQVERHVDRVIQIRDGRTSTERRWVERDEGVVADELVILDRVGRLQLPRHLVEELGLRDRVRVRREGDSLRIFRNETPHPDPPPQRGRERGGREK